MNNKLNTEFNLGSLADNVVGESTSTAERLYQGVCCLISFEGSIKKRLETASMIIAPLLVDDFKAKNQDKFIQLEEQLSNLQALEIEQLESISQEILNLYLSEMGIENPYIPIEEYQVLREIAVKTNQSPENVLRKAIALIKLAINAEENGYKIAITSGGRGIVTEIVGL